MLIHPIGIILLLELIGTGFYPASAQNAGCTQQPVATRLDPPSGTTGNDPFSSSTYVLTGQFLSATNIAVDLRGVGSTLQITNRDGNDTVVSFHIGSVHQLVRTDAEIRITPMADNCSTITIPITLFPPIDVRYPSSLVDLVAQPGTVIFMVQSSCLPGECGDNSTSFTVVLSSIPLETLDTQNTTLKYAGRLPNFVTIGSRDLSIVTEYQTFRVSRFLAPTLMPPGVVSSVLPSFGQRGTRVTITGTRLLGVGLNAAISRVLLGDYESEIVDDSSAVTTLQVRARSGMPIVNGSIVINSTQTFENRIFDGPYTYLQNGWTQISDGEITRIVPLAAQEGQEVYLCGAGILGGGNTILSAQFEGVSFPILVSIPSTPPLNISEAECIQVQVGSNSSNNATNGIITITSDTGSYVESSDNFTISSIQSVSPSRGQQGTIVTITGRGLLSGTMSGQPLVFLNEIRADLLSSSSTEIIVRARESPPLLPRVVNETTGATELPPQVFGVMGGVRIEVVNPFNTTERFTVSSSTGWQLEESGVINSVNPMFGQYSTLITIQGTNLLGYGSALTHVTVDGVNATLLDGASNVVVQILAPNITTTGFVDIILYSNTGAQIRGPVIFEYREAGVITEVFPREGQNGTYVTITGNNLLGYGDNITSIFFGNVPAILDYSTLNDTSIDVRVQGNNNTASQLVTVSITSDTLAIVQSREPIWTFLVPGLISNNTPQEGQAGTRIQVTGTNLLGGGIIIMAIFVDGVSALVENASDTAIYVIAGDLQDRQANVYPGQIFIESDTGAVVIGGTYTQRESGTIDTFSPARGRRGTRVTIMGTNLLGFGTRLEQIQLAGVVVDEVTFYNTSYIEVQAGFSNVSRSGPIVVTVDTGAIVMSSSNFTYDEPGLVTTVSPHTGAEGTGVSISGSGLLPRNVQLANITVGGILVSRVVTASTTEISVIVGPAPALNASNAEISITASDGSFVNGIFFSFINFVLSLPNLSLGREGTLVNVSLPNSSQFEPSINLRVTVGEQPADIVTLYSDERIMTVRIPRARLHGAYLADVAIEGLNGLIARLRDAFSYVSGGLICDIEPSVGQTGTVISLRGENFLGGSRSLMSAEVVGQQAVLRSFTNTTATLQLQQINSVILPLTGDVVLTAATGAVVRRLNNFTLFVPGSITAVSPPSGQNGTVVNIQGTGLLQGNLNVASVTLAGVPATVTGVPSDTLITVRAGFSAAQSSSPQAAVIMLSTEASITSAQTTQAMFQYLRPGSIASVNPNSGTVGTRITIQGNYLLQGGQTVSQVLLKGVMATVTNYSDTFISVVAEEDVQGQGDVVIISDTGATLTGMGLWTYNTLGAILEVSPAVSQQGRLVNISGFSLLGSADSIIECLLAGVVGTVVPPVSDSLVQCMAGNVSFSTEDSTGFVELVTNTGVVLNSSETNITFTYYASSIASVSPSQGNNGTLVTITGLNLFGTVNISSELSSIRFGSIEATILNSSLDLITVAVSLSDNSTSGDTLRIESVFGTFLELSNAWSYTDPGRIISVSPQSGFPGVEVEVFGENLFRNEGEPYRIIVGQTLGFSITVVNDSIATFRASLYQGSDLPEQELPIQIVSSTGETVFEPSVTFHYNETEANVLSVDSSAGSEGSLVAIAGINLPEISDITRITLAGVSANIVSTSNDTIVVMAGQPPSSGATGPVVIETSGFLLGLTGNAWTYFPVVTRSSVSPNTGQNGTEVTIDLSRIYPFPPVRSIYLGNSSTEIVQINGSIVNVIAGPSEDMSVGTLEDILIVFSDNITITIFDAWTYQEPVLIDQVSPPSGFFNTLVTITGRMFQAGGSVRVADVYLAGLNTTIVVQSNAMLQVRVAEELLNSMDIVGPIVIVADNGATFTSPSSLDFTYLGVTVNEITPSRGTEGTEVTLTGDSLLAGGSMLTSFMVGGITASFSPDYNSSSIRFVAGQSSVSQSQADIRYTVDTGAIVNIPNSWTYLEPGQIVFITPTAGGMGTLVSITGTGFFGGGTEIVNVYLNSQLATKIVSNFDYFVQVTSPAGNGTFTPGNVRIISNTGAITGSPSNIQFSYLQPAQFTSIVPSSGQNGTIVNITGTGFHNGEGIARVFLAGTEAAIISIENSSILVEAGRPSNLESITGPVVVQSILNTTSASGVEFTYLQEGVILSVTPDRGRNNTICLITGENLFGGGSMLQNVTLDGVAASIINQSSSSVYVRAGLPPFTSASTGNIILISETNSYVSRIDGWTNVAEGVIQTIFPQSGQFGTEVTIRGQNLLSGGSSLHRLLFDDVDLFETSILTDSIIMARIGQPDISGEFTSESVTLVSNFNSELYISYTWNFLNQSNITDLSPPSGLSNTVVNINGSNLLGGGTRITRATIGNIPARVISYSDQEVMIETGENGLGRQMTGMLVLESDTRALTTAEWQYEEECPNNTFGTVNNCTQCDIECAACTGPSNLDCITCTNFAILSSVSNATTTSSMECVSRCPNVSTLDNVCVDTCATNQYAQINTERNLTFCYNCSELCDQNLGCTGPASSQCNGCRFFLEVANQTCVETCPADRYYINQTKECRPCHEQCSGGCSGPTDRDCLACSDLTVVPTISSTFPTNRCTDTCPELYFEDSSRSRCIPCDSNCEGRCTDSTPFTCQQCRGPYFLYPNGTRKCVNECGPSYYQDTSNQCRICNEMCLANSTCIGPNPDDCLLCLRNQDGECILNCPAMFFANDFTLRCEACDASCGTTGCVTSSLNCISTQGPFSAGSGTIGIVIVIILILAIVIIVLVMFLVWDLKTKGNKLSFGIRSQTYHPTESNMNVDTPRYTRTTQVQDAPLSPNDIPLKSIETDHHVKNPMFDGEVYSEMGPEEEEDVKPSSDKKVEYIKTKGEEASLPEKNQPISASQDLYTDMDGVTGPLEKETTMDNQEATKPSLPEKNQPMSASQDLYMDMEGPNSPSSPLIQESSTDEKSAQSNRESMVQENQPASSGSPYIKMAPAQRALAQQHASSGEKSAGYSKVNKKQVALLEKNQPISGSQDLYTEMDAPKPAVPLIEEVTASQDVYTDMETLPPSLPSRDTDTAPIIPPKPTLKPPISVPPKTDGSKAAEKPPIPKKDEKPPPPGPPTGEPSEVYTDMDGGITEVFMNPVADDMYDDVATGTSPPPSSSVPDIDEGLYEDTESTAFMEEYRQSKRDMKLPPLPETKSDNRLKRQSAPALPSAPIPKKKTSVPLPITPLQKSLSTSSTRSNPVSPISPVPRPTSVASVPEEETLYDDIPGLSEQPLVPPSRNPPPKAQSKKQPSKGKLSKK